MERLKELDGSLEEWKWKVRDGRRGLGLD